MPVDPPIARGRKEPAIWIVAAPVALALAAVLAALIAARRGGFVRLLAQAVAVILGSLTGTLVGFVIPLAPVVDRADRHGVAGRRPRGTIGSLIAGMSLAEWLMERLDRKAESYSEIAR